MSEVLRDAPGCSPLDLLKTVGQRLLVGIPSSTFHDWSDEAFVAVGVNSSRAASDAYVDYLRASMLFAVKFPLWKTAFVVVVTLILVVFRLFNC